MNAQALRIQRRAGKREEQAKEDSVKAR
jgi:hypothetical protein